MALNYRTGRGGNEHITHCLAPAEGRETAPGLGDSLSKSKEQERVLNKHGARKQPFYMHRTPELCNMMLGN